ncbi:MAG: ParA family protein [Nitrospinae bacterium]|nr:ParA family protein [Nitrospinota bacterium]
MRSIAVVNQKGGVGKTTTAFNLGACLGKMGYRVLLVDLDPQANLSVYSGISMGELKFSVCELISESATADEIVVPTRLENVDILPSHLNLSAAEFELNYKVGRERVLADGLKSIIGKYDFVFIDCPPYLGMLTINALTAVKEVFIPAQAEFFALVGMEKLIDTIEIVRKRLNKKLSLSMVIPTFYDKRVRLSEETVMLLKGRYGKYIPKTVIRRDIRLAESPAMGQAIVNWKPSSRGSEDYMDLAKEVIDWKVEP